MRSARKYMCLSRCGRITSGLVAMGVKVGFEPTTFPGLEPGLLYQLSYSSKLVGDNPRHFGS